MKRILICFCLFFATAAASQAQDGRVVARLGVPFDAQVYAFLDGNFGEHFSYSVSTHFVNGDSTADLYRNTWKAWENNWCDWANLTYSIGNFSISAGKDMLLTGLYEFEPDDVDNYSFLCSSYWNEVVTYQLGIRAAYTIEAVSTTALIEFAASPFDEKPFGGHNTISFGLQGDFGAFQPYYTLNRMTMDEEIWGMERLYVLSLSNRFRLGDKIMLNADYLGRFSPSAKSASSILGGLEYSIIDGMKLTARAGWEEVEGSFGGLAFEFRPLSFLRCHAAGGYSQAAGALYDFGISLDLGFSR